MTGLILFVAAASLYATILGYWRIPFAAARDGDFFAVFARVHPTKHFPYVSLVAITLISLPFCFFSLGQLVSWLIQAEILVRFIWQCAAVILLRRYRTDIPQPFTMWLYPFPALLSLALWLYIFFTGPGEGIVFSFAFLGLAVVVHFAPRGAGGCPRVDRRLPVPRPGGRRKPTDRSFRAPGWPATDRHPARRRGAAGGRRRRSRCSVPCPHVPRASRRAVAPARCRRSRLLAGRPCPTRSRTWSRAVRSSRRSRPS